jgi:hypothetical protein
MQYNLDRKGPTTSIMTFSITESGDKASQIAWGWHVIHGQCDYWEHIVDILPGALF